MARYIGEIILRSQDNSDIFHQDLVHAANITDELEVKLLEDPLHINGFQADGKETELVESLPAPGYIPVDIEASNDSVRAIYRDGEVEDKQYDVIVYLLIEEEKEL